MAALFCGQQKQAQLDTEPPSSSYIEAIEASELDLIQHVKTSGVRKQVPKKIYYVSPHVLIYVFCIA